MLADTLATVSSVASTTGSDGVLVFDGDEGPGDWLPPGISVLPQRGPGLDARLAAAFRDIACPTFLIGSDTPHVSEALLAGALCRLEAGRVAIGPASDGGYWGIGLCDWRADVFTGVPMSRADTLVLTLARIRALRLEPSVLPELRDVDELDDLLAIAPSLPEGGRTRAVLAALEAQPLSLRNTS